MSAVSNVLETMGRKKTPAVEAASISVAELLAGTRKVDESVRAVLACNDYLRMGPGRTISGLLRRYKRLAKENGSEDSVPTTKPYTIYTWSWDFEWAVRAETFDAKADRDKSEMTRVVMDSGLATPHIRVQKLKLLAAKLEEEIYREGRLWLPDVKQIGSGKYAQVFNLLRFNSSLVEQYRGVLSDLAEETGGRWKVNRNYNVDLNNLTDEQLQQLAEGKEIMPMNTANAKVGTGGKE